MVTTTAALGVATAAALVVATTAALEVATNDRGGSDSLESSLGRRLDSAQSANHSSTIVKLVRGIARQGRVGEGCRSVAFFLGVTTLPSLNHAESLRKMSQNARALPPEPNHQPLGCRRWESVVKICLAITGPSTARTKRADSSRTALLAFLLACLPLTAHAACFRSFHFFHRVHFVFCCRSSSFLYRLTPNRRREFLALPREERAELSAAAAHPR